MDLNALLEGTDHTFRNEILSLRTIFTDEVESNEKCSICLDKFSSTYTELFMLGCDHIFHKECCINWLKSKVSKMTCPSCRRHAITGEKLKVAKNEPQTNLSLFSSLSYTLS